MESTKGRQMGKPVIGITVEAPMSRRDDPRIPPREDAIPA